MSTARPDTSRRREPSCPGRRFGISARSTARFSTISLLSLLALFVAAASAVGAEEPILLSNEDVVRLHATAPSAGTSAADANGPDADPAQTAHVEAQLRRQLDRIERESMDRISRALDERAVDGAADALPVSAPPPVGASRRAAPAATSAPASPAPADAEVQASSDEPTAELFQPADTAPEPACIYGPSGHLLFAPEGRTCASVRYGRPANTIQGVGSQSKTAAATQRAGDAAVGCVYGSRGQLLYASHGVTCAAK